MLNSRLSTVGVGAVGGVLLLGAVTVAGPQREGPGDRVSVVAQEQLLGTFQESHPGVLISETAGRIGRIYGRAFSHGETSSQSAEAFIGAHAGILGVEPEDLVPIGDGLQPIMYLPETDTYKFHGYFHRQEKDGVPVFRSALKLLVRNEPGFPLVLASADLRDLRGLQLDGAAAAGAAAAGGEAAARNRVVQLSVLDGDPQVVESRKVIWAGVDDMVVEPRLADEWTVALDADLWLVLTDAASGEVLFEDQLIYIVDIVGNVQGLATEGVGSEQCESEVATPLPYLRVTAGANSAFSDVNGDFVIPNPGALPIDVSATLDGQWFDVFNFVGLETSELLMGVVPPGPADFLFNSGNLTEEVRAEVNGYVETNRIRDFVLQFNPAYPLLGNTNFPVTVNRTDGFCPGNAWYSSGGGGSINFCLAGGGSPNTSWSSVIHHEYGHHLVRAAGSGQNEYGEGMGDVMSVLILDNPLLGLGFFGSCLTSLRNADNTCVYQPVGCSSCGSAIHICGQILSGCVWSTRNQLLITEPVNYLNILADLAINSILLHTGSAITPDIAIDFLTLDDTDADICNGTPHFAEIAAGFGAHGMFQEDLNITFPSGLPVLVSPAGGTTVPVTVSCDTAPPQPGTGLLHVNTGIFFVAIPMNEISPNVYDAVFPSSLCPDVVEFYFSAETASGEQIFEPTGAPTATFSAFSATSINAVFADDFEADLGWSVQSAAADGPWGRGIPINCNRGDPPADADGSGNCFLTDNSAANSCNSDVDNGSTILTSPTMDASGGGDIHILYSRWYSNTVGASPMQDIFLVEVSDDDGANWVTLETVGPSGAEVNGGWFLKSFQVADFVTLTNQFRIRFTASDTDPQSVVEAAVDGVQLVTVSCAPTCPWDCQAAPSGSVDVPDLLALLGAWGGPQAPGTTCDLDGSGAIAVPDLLDLLANWGPCP